MHCRIGDIHAAVSNLYSQIVEWSVSLSRMFYALRKNIIPSRRKNSFMQTIM